MNLPKGMSPKASFLNRPAVAAQANDVEDVLAIIDSIDSRRVAAHSDAPFY
ncbi:hypothetical protein [Mesorhizobium sp.]|uniref:hypothetical protein n=1 Tax=Mesorhizobium sp. TaxID=1871066 RepID=UPI0025FA1963|nr:hypothetical protein [Mesorhizobium sp.]